MMNTQHFKPVSSTQIAHGYDIAHCVSCEKGFIFDKKSVDEAFDKNQVEHIGLSRDNTNVYFLGKIDDIKMDKLKVELFHAQIEDLKS